MNFYFCACAHNSLSDVVPRLWNPIIIVVVIRDPLTIGDIPSMCSISMSDRQSWFPHSGFGGVPREYSTWPIARLLRKKADQKGEVGSFISEEENGHWRPFSRVDRTSSLFSTWGSPTSCPLDVNVFPVAKRPSYQCQQLECSRDQFDVLHEVWGSEHGLSIPAQCSSTRFSVRRKRK